MSEEYILKAEGITKKFPGVVALDNVDLNVKNGEVHCLVGENGAGKSTLINCFTGVHTPDNGHIIWRGKEVKIENPLHARKLGISVVHQELNVAENLTVYENIFLGRPIMKDSFLKFTVNFEKMKIEAKNLLEKLNIDLDVTTEVSHLSIAHKQIVEIAKAISVDCSLLIMDEPSSALTDEELDTLFEIINRLSAQGVSKIYISHRLEEIFEIGDRVTVLRDGKLISTRLVEETSEEKLISDMVNRKIETMFPKIENEIGEEVLRVEGLTNEKVDNINFSLRKGEILGIAGLVGSGRTELARAVFGADKITSGKLFIKGKEIKIDNVSQAIKEKVGLVPEERKLHGLVLDMTVRENITLVGIDNVISGFSIDKSQERDEAKKYVKQLNIVTPGVNQYVKSLSGGNQQKVVLAKWLFADSDILIFDEPTRGIDVQAKHEIYKLLNRLIARGKSIIMISSEMPELIGMCDRIIVMHEGKKTGELKRKEATQENIMKLAVRSG